MNSDASSNGAGANFNGRIPYRDMRGLLEHLEANGELLRISKPVPPKYLHTLLAKSDQAVLFETFRTMTSRLSEG